MTTAPLCISCNKPSRLTDGREVYPHRPDLHRKPLWKCDGCSGYVGCHPGTDRPLGVPADAPTRHARMKLHNERLDPLWAVADRAGFYKPDSKKARWKIRRVARYRVYSYLADKLGIPYDQCHVGLFDIERCRKAWTILSGVDYPQIRAWFKAREHNSEAA